MYDNLDFRLSMDDIGETDFLNEIPNYLNEVSEHNYENGYILTGNLDGLKVSVSERSVKVGKGSLCKYYLGDNFQTLTRTDTKQAIEKLSDTLHLPMDKATVSRIDVAQNFILEHPVEVYYNHLGELPYYKRSLLDGSLYYNNSKGSLVFYNKIKEQKAKSKPIPLAYQGENTLRYEMRFTKRLPKTFNVFQVTGESLYNERFYTGIINRWGNAYKAIRKINDFALNFDSIKRKKDFDSMGRRSLIKEFGGELAMISMVAEAYKCDKLARRQADVLKQAIREASKQNEEMTIENNIIRELDEQIDKTCLAISLE